MAKKLGEIEALRLKLKERDERDQRKEDVQEALKRLDGRPLGADLKDKLTTFHKDHGPNAFKAYVESMIEHLGKVPDTDSVTAENFAGQTKDAPAVAMRYQEHGAEAVQKAARFSAEWEQLHRAGFTHMSQDRYVELNMSKHGIALKRDDA